MGGSWGLDGAGALSLHLLAARVTRFFPRCIPPLVDLSGKKHLHTAVVRLPVVSPQLLATVVQEALRCGMQISAEEQDRNRMLPSDLLVSEALYREALAGLRQAAAAAAVAVDSDADAGPGPGPTANPDIDRVAWHLLLAPMPPPKVAAPAPAGAAAVVPSVSGAGGAGVGGGGGGNGGTGGGLRVGGALGLLLSQRSRAAAAPPPAGPPPVALCVDVAGLPVASTRAALLPGTWAGVPVGR
ncbi:hypothetical protein GPECTOR_78g62 [Gonium pectorale]|uniref:Uncharacterized protein n=1 Tax=Gonium pectorale TaxID=33097 RepID=A0A150G231_GONPE|nr:hypothetical protein GPECTOR_78g62 [Gonium pectorale]|eukprot:KXZ43874.1 hypothetical protein GPECTOR_78g62 [Gonium pectorale]